MQSEKSSLQKGREKQKQKKEKQKQKQKKEKEEKEKRYTGESGHSCGKGDKVKKYVRETKTSLVPDAIPFQVHTW